MRSANHYQPRKTNTPLLPGGVFVARMTRFELATLTLEGAIVRPSGAAIYADMRFLS